MLISFFQCRTLQEAREILKREDITLVLLDVNLPDGNGLDFVREIKKNNQVPIILLTVNNAFSAVATLVRLPAITNQCFLKSKAVSIE